MVKRQHSFSNESSKGFRKKRIPRKDRNKTGHERMISFGDGIVLNFYPQGKSFSKRKPDDYNPLAVIITTDGFRLLDVILKKRTVLKKGEKINFSSIKSLIINIRRVDYNQLSVSCLEDLPNVIASIVDEEESKYVNFYNNARPVTTQLHQLRLLPGVGQKRMWAVIEARSKKPFESFEDIKIRANISDPKALIIQRILSEISGEQKHYLFVKQ